MGKALRRYGVGAMAASVLAGGMAFTIHGEQPAEHAATGQSAAGQSTARQSTAAQSTAGQSTAGQSTNGPWTAGDPEAARPRRHTGNSATNTRRAATKSATAKQPHVETRRASGPLPWRPTTSNLDTRPERLLPATISGKRPARILTTTIDHAGRPITKVHTATDRDTATELIRNGQQTLQAVGVELDVPISAAAIPSGSDPLRGNQWDLDRIDVADAWTRSTGAGVTVAVVDSGVDSTHPDLAGQILPGVDLLTGTAGPSTDGWGHGTHVAGIIAASADNGAGIIGAAPDVKILPVRVLNDHGNGFMSDAANGIVYAADHGADVINLSISAATQVDAVTNAIAYARSRGAVIVAAAGNTRAEGSPTSFPGADPGVIAVAATDSADRIAGFSNQGGYVDLAAPGTGILSTFRGGGYAWMDGTSMASPQVAAVAALLKAADPTMTPDRVEATLEASATDLGPAGRDDDFGHGRLDAAAALATLAVGPPTPAPTSN